MWQFFSVRSFYYGVAIQSSAINVPPLSSVKMKETSRSFILISEALVTFIAKVEGVVKEKFSGAEPQTPTQHLLPPPIKIPGGATALHNKKMNH